MPLIYNHQRKQNCKSHPQIFLIGDARNKQTRHEFPGTGRSPHSFGSCQLLAPLGLQGVMGWFHEVSLAASRRPAHTGSGGPSEMLAPWWYSLGETQATTPTPRSGLLEACWLPCSNLDCSVGEQGLNYQQPEKQRPPEHALQLASTKGPGVAISSSNKVEAPRTSNVTWVPDLSTEVCLTIPACFLSLRYLKSSSPLLVLNPYHWPIYFAYILQRGWVTPQVYTPTPICT